MSQAVVLNMNQRGRVAVFTELLANPNLRVVEVALAPCCNWLTASSAEISHSQQNVELAEQFERPESEELAEQLEEQGLRRPLEQDQLLDLAEQLDEPMLLNRLKSLEHLVWRAVKKRSPALATSQAGPSWVDFVKTPPEATDQHGLAPRGHRCVLGAPHFRSTMF